MRRLTGAVAGRLRQERGAVAVFVALSMTVLLAFAAIAIDTSAIRRDQQLLRNAADAAALAVALDCARAADPLDPTCHVEAATLTATATSLVQANAGGGATPTVSGSTHRSVTVTVSADASRPIPIGPDTVSVDSTAVWAPATIGYTASYPLAISYCRYLALPKEEPYHLASEPKGLELLPPRQEITPAAWTGNDTCLGPYGSLTIRKSVMTPTDPGAPCGTSSARGRNVTGQAFEPVTFAARTCVASSQYQDVTKPTHGGYQIVLPVYDQVQGDQYRVWGYLGFHVMGVTGDGGVWGFSTGPMTSLSDSVPSFVQLAIKP